MNQPAIFNFHTSHIRVVHKDGDPWFVAKDIAEALEYSEGTVRSMTRVIAHVPEVWRGLYQMQTPSGVQDMAVLSEAGMFFFLNRSDKPKALPFQMWLAGDVLPAIRKTGGYQVPEPPLVRPGQVEALKAGRDLALVHENDELRDALSEQVAINGDLKDELLDLYRDRSPARKVVEKLVYQVPVEAIELMVEYGIPRDRIAAVSGRSRTCLRVHIHNARKAGRLQ